MMRADNPTLVLIVFIVGVIVSAIVSAFVPSTQWMGLHWMFLFLASMIMEKLFGAAFSAHRVLTYGLGAVFHGLLIALLFFLVLLCFPRLTRRGAVISMVVIFVIDLVLLVLVSPMRELP